MLNKVLLTPVDDLVELVKINPNCSVSFVRDKIRMPQEIVEKWIVVLEEYNILSVNYKGFEGYLNISEHMKKDEEEKKAIDVEKLKDIFIERSKIKKFDYNKMQQLWPLFLKEYEGEIKALFEDKAKSKGYDANKVEKAWARYKEELIRL